MSMISEVGTYLAANGLGTVGVDLFEGLNPPEPDTLTALFERPGRPPIRASANKIVAEQPSLLVVTRALDYETGYQRIKAVKDRLQNFVGTLSGTRYLEISANQGIHSVGQDERRRFHFSLNFNVRKEAS